MARKGAVGLLFHKISTDRGQGSCTRRWSTDNQLLIEMLESSSSLTMRTMTVKEIEKMELKHVSVMSNAVPNTVHRFQKERYYSLSLKRYPAPS